MAATDPELGPQGSSTSWADLDAPRAPPKKTEAKSNTDAAVAQITKALASTKVEEKETPSGLDPDDAETEVEITGVESDYRSAKTFAELGLSPELLKGITAQNWVYPSAIQAASLPLVLGKKKQNVIAQGKNGSGKTGAYSLAMISSVKAQIKEPQAICMCPTRELADQIHKVVSDLSEYTGITSYLATPGSSRKEKITAQILVGTPGTLLAKMRKEYDPKKIVMLVLDEADQMLHKDGFADNSLKLQKNLPKTVQILLFSATFGDNVLKFANKFAPRAAQITKKKEDLKLTNVIQFYVDVKVEAKKYEILSAMYGLLNLGQSVVFVNTVATAKELANRMRGDGYSVSLLHGRDMDAADRTAVMKDFREQKTTVLIATNLIARGINVPQVNLVVNYDLPMNYRTKKTDPDSCDTYLHRIGRAGRFGAKGAAVNLVHDDTSRASIAFISKYFKAEIKPLNADDFDEMSATIKECLGMEE